MYQLRVDVDLAFLLFLVADWVWLWATGRLAGAPARPWRVGLAAALAALAGVWAMFPSGAWLRFWPVKVAGSLAIVAVAYAGRRPLRSMVRLLVFYLGTGAGLAGFVLLLVGGTVRGMALFPGEGGRLEAYTGPVTASPSLALVGLGLALVGGYTVIDAARSWRRLSAELTEVEVQVGGGQVRVTGLIDTGNRLREPISGWPAVVVEGGALRDLLPAAVLEQVSTPDAGGLPPEWAARCRAVPYRAVGARGWLLAVRPDGVRVGGRVVTAYLALAPGPLDPAGRFQALVPGDLPDGAEFTWSEVAGYRREQA